MLYIEVIIGVQKCRHSFMLNSSNSKTHTKTRYIEGKIRHLTFLLMRLFVPILKRPSSVISQTATRDKPQSSINQFTSQSSPTQSRSHTLPTLQNDDLLRFPP